jgi:hypothetical protein
MPAADACQLCCDIKPLGLEMRPCPTCQTLVCISCINRWAYQQLQEDCQPTCPFCRGIYDVTVLHNWFNELWEYHRNLNNPTIEDDFDVANESVEATLVRVWDLPPPTWNAYFGLLGWTPPERVDQGLWVDLTEEPEVEQRMELNWMDDEQFDMLYPFALPSRQEQQSQDPVWTPRRDLSPSDISANRRNVRRRLVYDRRNERSPLRFRRVRVGS